jgi:LPXTG-motif cell wall-anchored protein
MKGTDRDHERNGEMAMNNKDDKDAKSKSDQDLPRTGSTAREWMLLAGLGAFAAAFGQRLLRKRLS